MIKIEDKSKCCGCAACFNICPKDAIQMVPDDLGFEYPEVDFDKCIDCGLCERICTFTYPKTLKPTLSAYGARHTDIKEVTKSRSGGVFIALSDYILENNGAVYGASLDEDLLVSHQRATTKVERDLFRGSKYVQSSIKNTFKEVKKDLQDGKMVLFSGTPCQISGLQSFIRNDLHKNLYTIDIICHGVPSPAFYESYIKYIEKKKHGKIVSFNFRDKKKYGWALHFETAQLSRNGKTIGLNNLFYTNYYYKGFIYRKSCEKCNFCNRNRAGDITIGDFWGWQKSGDKTNQDNLGLNIVMINSEKGELLFNLVKSNIHSFETNWPTYDQPNLNKPSQPHKEAEAFQTDFIQNGIEYILRKYDIPMSQKWRQQLRRIKYHMITILQKSNR